MKTAHEHFNDYIDWILKKANCVVPGRMKVILRTEKKMIAEQDHIKTTHTFQPILSEKMNKLYPKSLFVELRDNGVIEPTYTLHYEMENGKSIMCHVAVNVEPDLKLERYGYFIEGIEEGKEVYHAFCEAIFELPAYRLFAVTSDTEKIIEK